MAVKQSSKRMTLQLMLVLFLGWSMLLMWVLVQWALNDYAFADKKLSKIVESQRAAIKPIYHGSLLSFFPIEQNIQISFNHPILNKLEVNKVASDLILKAKYFIHLVLLTSQYILIKLMILAASVPLFGLAVMAGFIDGLNQRAIRTACLGRESSYVFHRLNYYLKQGLIIVLLLWLALPVSINPALVFIPVSLTLALMVAMTTSRFKKYI
jgi:hypothetical protein